MIDKFYKNTIILLAFLILNNYLLLSLKLPLLLIKINLIIFFGTILFFYFKFFLENIYLKIFFVIIIIISLGTPAFEWDPRSIWLFHAKRIFYDQSIFSVIDNYAVFSHNDYPALAPAFASSISHLIGHWNEIFPKLSFTFMFLPPLILTYVFLKDYFYIIFLSIVFFIIGKYLFNGWADGLVAVYFCLSSFLIYKLIISKDYDIEENSSLYVIAFLFFIILTLIKNEGVALLTILFLATIFILVCKKQLKQNLSKLLFLSLSFLPIIFWKFFCYYNGIGFNDYINVNFLSNLLPRLDDFENYKLISYFLFLNEKFVIALSFFIISFSVRKNRKLFEFILIIILMYVLILFFVFLSTPYDFYWQLDSTAARVVKTLSFLLAFFGLYNLNNNKIKLHK